MTNPDRSDMLATTPFQLRSRERALLRNGEPVKIGARAMEILIALAERPGELVSKNDLLDRVWPNQQIEEAALRVHLSALRRLLGTDDQERPLIVNENGRGYRLVADLIDQRPAQLSSDQLRKAFPTPLTAIIGRDELIAEMARLSASCRLLTLCGPGGVGKTTIATAAALRICDARGTTPVFFDLTQLRHGESIVAALVELLGCQASGAATIDDAIRALADRDWLVVFDNCEHVIDSVAETAEVLLRSAPRLSIIATSREPLRAEGEWLVRVPALDLPDNSENTDIDSVLKSPAALLFVERARAQDSSWRVSENDAPALANICRRMDGLPLALEMAAAKLASMSLIELDRFLEENFSTLASGRRTVSPRHRTLQAVTDWSYDLLNRDEKLLFLALSLFDGDFTLEDARNLAGEFTGPCCAFEDRVASLTAKSLLVVGQGAGATRYRMLHTIRAFAASKLEAWEEVEAD